MTTNGWDSEPEMTAALYAAGALPHDERVAFEARLDAGDAECLEEMSRLGPALETLFASVVPVDPTSSVRDSLLQKIAPKITSPFFVQRSAEADWQETSVPGVQTRLLFEDHERNIRSSLFRLQPGAGFPEHPHPGVEECFVIEGDVWIGDVYMQAGDYMRAPAGTEHGFTYSKQGCLLMLTFAL